MPEPIKNVAFFGLGTMGGPMAANLAKCGFNVTAWNRSPQRLDVLSGTPIRACRTIRDAVAGASSVVMMLWDEAAANAVLFGPGGVAESAARGTVIIDMSTTTPAHARECDRRLEKVGLKFLDAPVSGAQPRALSATLAVMVGGDADVLDSVRHVIAAMASSVELMGPVGSGQLVKLANNLIGFQNVLAVCEGLALVAAAGGEMNRALAVLRQSTADSEVLKVYGPKLAQADFDSAVTAAVALKDLRAALATGREVGVRLPGLHDLVSLYERLVGAGGGAQGCHAIYPLLKQESL